MLTTLELLAAVKAAQGIPSNYRLARVLDVPETTVQRWSTGRNLPDDAMCLRLAALAGLDAGQVVASIHAERAADGPLREFWALQARRLQGVTAASAAVVLSLFVGGGPDAGAHAAQVEHGAASGQNAPQSVYYVNLRRRIRRRLAALAAASAALTGALFRVPTYAAPAACR